MKIGWLFFLGLLTFSSVAIAQDDSRYQEARSKASEAFKQGDFEEAALLFQEAFDASPKGNLLYNIGFCYEKSGKLVKAVTFYERFVSAMPESNKRPAVQQKINALQKNLRGKFETVTVTTNPPGAIIFVDDRSKGAMGKSPAEFRLIPGGYLIIADLKGHESAQKTLSLKEGQGGEVSLQLIPKGQVGSVALLVSEKGASIKVDNRSVGKSPLQKPLRLRAGRHEVKVMKPGFTAWKKTIDVVAGKKDRVQVTLTDESGGAIAAGNDDDDDSAGGSGNIWPWVTMGVGVAAIGGGAFLGLQTQSLYDELDTKRKDDQQLAAADLDTGAGMVRNTNILFGVGGAALVGGLAWYLLGGDSVESEGSLSGGMTPEGDPMVGYSARF